MGQPDEDWLKTYTLPISLELAAQGHAYDHLWSTLEPQRFGIEDIEEQAKPVAKGTRAGADRQRPRSVHAHNSYAGDARTTEMSRRGEPHIGLLIK